MTFLNQLRAQLLIIVYFSVENDALAAIFVVDRLLTTGQIDNAEPPVTQPGAAVEMRAAVVRSPMRQRRTSVPLLFYRWRRLKLPELRYLPEQDLAGRYKQHNARNHQGQQKAIRHDSEAGHKLTTDE
jgi:hypothetical protein